MNPLEFYNDNLVILRETLKKLKQRKSSFAWLRLGSIAAIIVALYVLSSLGFIYIAIACVVLVFTFIRLVYADIDNQVKIDHTNKLININEDEIKALNGDYFHFPDGANHIPKDHAYANDLDIFGRASLFQYLNRTTSEQGSTSLADYLKFPASEDMIAQRQQAIVELSKDAKWIQDLQGLGRKTKITFSSQNRLKQWMQEPPVFSKFAPWKWLRYLLPAIILSGIFLFAYDYVSASFFLILLLVYMVIAYQINKYVAPIHEKLSRIADELSILSASVRHIENRSFEHPLLKKMQLSFIEKDTKASQNIDRIKKLLDKLDYRYNLVFVMSVNIVLLWSLQQVLDLEKWKADQKETLDKWFETLADFEALNSLAVLHFNHPGWIFPTIVSNYFQVEGKEIGHPLIPEGKRVDNYIDIPDNSKLMLVTGSNMAGKSTYLRSIGVNVVLAMAGGPACAKEFKVSHVQIISSMRITDNLEESTSTFYAELKKLKTIIEKVNAGERVFILLDEILRGTNSLDRHTGSKALIKQLIRQKAAAIIATHDLELANLKDEFSDNILNYHFDVQVENEELFFDYQLKPGICTSLNASILMKKIGIEL
ncbi:MAG: hypothetical protein ABIP35_16685 [Ginsengibacter sp.]